MYISGNISVTVNKTTYVGRTGGSTTLGCSVKSRSKVVSVLWYLRGIPIKIRAEKYSGSTPKSPSLNIQNLEASDLGPYKCSATNRASITANSTYTTLTLHDIDEDDKEGKTNTKEKKIEITLILTLILTKTPHKTENKTTLPRGKT